jgi:phytanoyl-CoA dioxygenase PhyH
MSEWPSPTGGLTADQRTLLPSDNDVIFYQEHGWYKTPIVLTDAEINEAIAGARATHMGDRDVTLPQKIDPHIDWTPDQGSDILRMNHYIVQQNLLIRKLSFNPVIGAIAARLCRSSQVRLFVSSLFYKPPRRDGEVRVGWHTDRAYWRSCTSERMFTASIPLHDCDDDMGPPIMIDGSHLWDSSDVVRDIKMAKTFSADGVADQERRLAKAGVRIRKVSMSLKKGQIAFHHCNVLHGSGLNLTDAPRLSVVLHLQDKDNRYQRPPSGVAAHSLDKFCRQLADGSPDYSDPIMCPVLWDEGRHETSPPYVTTLCD